MDKAEGNVETQTQYLAGLSSNLKEFFFPQVAVSPVGISQAPTQC